MNRIAAGRMASAARPTISSTEVDFRPGIPVNPPSAEARSRYQPDPEVGNPASHNV